MWTNLQLAHHFFCAADQGVLPCTRCVLTSQACPYRQSYKVICTCWQVGLEHISCSHSRHQTGQGEVESCCHVSCLLRVLLALIESCCHGVLFQAHVISLSATTPQAQDLHQEGHTEILAKAWYWTGSR